MLKQALSTARKNALRNYQNGYMNAMLMRCNVTIKQDGPLAQASGEAGGQIYFNEQEVKAKNLTAKHIEYIYHHEIRHIAFAHVDKTRFSPTKYPNKQLLYYCMECVVNAMVDDLLGVSSRPPFGIFPEDWMRGLSVDAIYSRLNNSPNELGAIDLDFESDIAQTDDSNDKAKLDQAIMVAATLADSGGSSASGIPDFVRDMIHKLQHPSLPYDVVLEQYLFSKSNMDFSYSKPNIKTVPDIMPVLDGEGFGKAIIAWDLSVSVTEAEMQQYINDTYHILQTLNPEETTVISFSNTVTQEKVITSAEEVLEIKLHSTGGTQIEPVFEYAAQKHEAELLIIFTDLEIWDMPSENPLTYDVIWLSTGSKHNNSIATFGEVINIQKDN